MVFSTIWSLCIIFFISQIQKRVYMFYDYALTEQLALGK